MTWNDSIARRRVAFLLIPLALSCGEPAGPPPPPQGVQTLSVTPARDTLVSVNETAQLVAVGRDHAGAVLPGAVFAWESSDATVASVSTAGLVTALKNGSATITVSSNGFSSTATIVVRQRAATLEVLTGGVQAGTVGAPLDTAMVFVAKDAGGTLAAGVAVSFTPVTGAGVAVPAEMATTTAGEATTQWTLGPAAGSQQIVVKAVEDPAVSLTIETSAFAAEPDTMFVAAGDAQSELPGRTLPAPIQVKIVDRFANPIPDVPITFAVTSGGGTLDSTNVFSDLDGVARTLWTLGPGLGAQTVQAILPDSAVGAIVDLPGSPTTFTATAVVLAISSVAATPVVGQEIVITGTGFDPVPENNSVSVGDSAATVVSVAAGLNELRAIVPAFGCSPAQQRTVSVTRDGNTVSTSTVVLPANGLALALGQSAVLDDPAEFCLQFLSAAGGTDEYLVGITSPRALNGELPFVVNANDGITVAPAVGGEAAAMAGSGAALSREHTLRLWEETFLATPGMRRSLASLRAMPVARASAVGDIVALRVPDITTDACNAFTSVNARVVAMGPRVTIATDATLPTDPASVLALEAALNGFLTTYGALIYGVATTYFGVPADLDQDQRITLLFSPAVNALGVPTFTTAVDQVAPAVCPASNQREMIYVAVPAAPTVPQLTALLTGNLPALTHDLTHLIQLSRRISGGGFPLPLWLAEGQATLGVELAGRAVRGDAGYQDHGAAIVNANATSLQWYKPLFDNLSFLFGWNGAGGSIAGAPDRCSVFGFSGLSTPCVGTFGTGAAWSFLRFLGDRLSAATGGEAAFNQAVIGTTPAGSAIAVLETLANASLDDLLVQWAMMLYTDGRVAAGAAPALQITSWNLAEVFNAMPAAQRLAPATFGFASFVRGGSVVGGGTAYTRISAAGAHGPLALSVRDAAGNALGAELRPRLWVVRIK